MRGIDDPLEKDKVGMSQYSNLPTAEHVEKVFKNLRQKLNPSEVAQVLDLKTNVLIWGLFLSTTMKNLSSSWTKLQSKIGQIQDHQI